MRWLSLALSRGIGRRVTVSVAVAGALLFALLLASGTLLEHRQARERAGKQLAYYAGHGSIDARNQLSVARSILTTLVEAQPRADANGELLRAQLVQTGLFVWSAIASIDKNGSLAAGARAFQIGDLQLDAVRNGRSILLSAPRSEAGSGLYMVIGLGARHGLPVVIAELSSSGLPPIFGNVVESRLLTLLDRNGDAHGPSKLTSPALQQLFRARLESARTTSVAEFLAWNADGAAWTGILRPVWLEGIDTTAQLAVLSAAKDPDALAAVLVVTHRLWPMIPVMAVLALLAGYLAARSYAPVLRNLRRALAQLPDHPTQISADDQVARELRQLIEVFNRSSAAIDLQRETQKALIEIDALLLNGREFEGVVDGILSSIRKATRAHHVSITLLEHGVAVHGRNFTVAEHGGFPVHRVVLDAEMTQTLCASPGGLTVVRCEEVRHSFLLPMQAAGSRFFWVWPVLVGKDMAAILSIGYFEPPAFGARVAGCGTQSAQRLGISLSSAGRIDRLYHQAHFDPLTNLPNRLLFRDRLTQELAAAAENPTRVALLFIDLDHFKKINDSLGHQAGDRLLQVAAQRLRSCVKEGDTVARLGGDEFTIILRNVSGSEDVAIVVERISVAMQIPVRLDGKDHPVRASIGVAMFPDDGADPDELTRSADMAMYCAKDSGRGKAVFYHSNMNDRTARIADSGLYRALKRREFSLHYQPQYRVSDGALLGAEALLRWDSPRGGSVSPAEFIPAAEESGLIVDIGGWVLEAVCMQIIQWQESGLSIPKVCVNISVQQLRDSQFPGAVSALFDRFQISPALIEFEINEATLTDDGSQECLLEITAIGVGLVLDDFGTGSTAMANLRRYPVSTVKIDRSFVDAVTFDPAAAALVSTIIVMAKSLGRKVVAEGVENIEQFSFLRDRNCDGAQGYFLARPLPVAEMTELLGVAARRQPDSIAHAAQA
jgi:diguanylate cyclase (GGDEF)-like protein